MRTPVLITSGIVSLGALAFLVGAGTGCKDIECGDGTIDRDGTCEPATLTTSAAACGPFTELQGDRCVPQFAPTVCDPTTSMPSVDPATGVTTCVGGGGGGCGGTFACPNPSSGKVTVCGQLYDFEQNLNLEVIDAAGGLCDPASPATRGPCAVALTAYDAADFAANPATATKLSVGTTYLDDCGRFRLVDITPGASPFVGLGIDDAGMTPGPAGVTVTTGLAVSKGDIRIDHAEAYVVKASTVAKWESSGGPPLSGGIYVATYRAHKLADGVDRHAPQAGVKFANIDGTTTYDADDYYFNAPDVTHETIDPAASVTGANGSALITNRMISEGLVFGGNGGIGSGCRWQPHAAASLPGIVFFQVYRKIDQTGMPGACTE